MDLRLPFNQGPLLEKRKLTANGNNYANWICTLRSVLRGAKKNYILDAPILAIRTADASDVEKDVYTMLANDNSTVQGFMLTCMDPEQ
jgi:hypothetical protein